MNDGRATCYVLVGGPGEPCPPPLSGQALPAMVSTKAGTPGQLRPAPLGPCNPRWPRHTELSLHDRVRTPPESATPSCHRHSRMADSQTPADTPTPAPPELDTPAQTAEPLCCLHRRAAETAVCADPA